MMKKINRIMVMLGASLILLSGCSGDGVLNEQPQYLNAKVDGESFAVDNINGVLSSEKFLTPQGSINLLMKSKSSTGKSILLFVDNYVGAGKYQLNNSPYNSNWMQYAEILPQGQWDSNNKTISLLNINNFIEITEDNGNYIKGNFSFEGYQVPSHIFKKVSEGVFTLKFKVP